MIFSQVQWCKYTRIEILMFTSRLVRELMELLGFTIHSKRQIQVKTIQVCVLESLRQD